MENDIGVYWEQIDECNIGNVGETINWKDVWRDNRIDRVENWTEIKV